MLGCGDRNVGFKKHGVILSQEGASLSYGTMPWFCHWASRVVQNHWRGTRGKETGLSRSGKHEVGTMIAGFPQGREGLTLQSDEKTGSSG